MPTTTEQQEGGGCGVLWCINIVEFGSCLLQAMIVVRFAFVILLRQKNQNNTRLSNIENEYLQNNKYEEEEEENGFLWHMVSFRSIWEACILTCCSARNENGAHQHHQERSFFVGIIADVCQGWVALIRRMKRPFGTDIAFNANQNDDDEVEGVLLLDRNTSASMPSFKDAIDSSFLHPPDMIHYDHDCKVPKSSSTITNSRRRKQFIHV